MLVDLGCRNTVFCGQANAVADDLGRLVARGVRRLRVELLREAAAAAEALVRDSGEVLTERKDGVAVRRRAGVARRLGVLRVEG